jgi:tetratricopeptide (TPR) repeat protein
MDTERLEKAVAMRESGRVKEALREFVSLTESATDPEEKASVLLNEARCYRLLGRLPEARERLALARSIMPKTEGLLYLEEEDAILHWHEGDRATALKILDGLHAEYGRYLVPGGHEGLYTRIQSSRGMLLAELGRYSEAAPLLERSLESNSSEIDKDGVLHDLGLSYTQLGRGAAAKETLERLLREGLRADLVPSARLYLGDVYFHEGAYAKAMMEFEWCLAHAGEHKIPTPYLYKWLATTARALGMKEDAERYDRLAKR